MGVAWQNSGGGTKWGRVSSRQHVARKIKNADIGADDVIQEIALLKRSAICEALYKHVSAPSLERGDVSSVIDKPLLAIVRIWHCVLDDVFFSLTDKSLKLRFACACSWQPGWWRLRPKFIWLLALINIAIRHGMSRFCYVTKGAPRLKPHASVTLQNARSGEIHT